MRTWLILMALVAFAITGCDSKPGAPLPDGSAPAAAAASDHSWLWGLGGYLLGRATAPSAPAAPSHTTVIQRNVIVRSSPAVEPPKPSATPRPVAPSVPSFKPSSPPAPSFRPSPAPSYSAPSFSRGYSAPSYSFRR